MEIKKQYNTFMDLYVQLTESYDAKANEHFKSFFDFLLENLNILDIGCGSGHEAKYYVERDAHYFGCDSSEVSIVVAKKQNIGNFIVAEMENLPYKNNSFDLVIGKYALQTSNNVQKSLEESIRVAKPGANIIILTKHPTHNLLEGWKNDNHKDYFNQRIVTSKIYGGQITLKEPGHTLMEYLSPEVLSAAILERLEEGYDFLASEQIISNLITPTYMIMQFRKN